MTIHKLSAGDGYTYLTKHTANGDAPESRVKDAADYYTAAGAPPGRWHGKLTELVGVEVGQVVTESHMRSVFGAARTPTALESKPPASAGIDALIEWSQRTALGRGFVKTERADYVLDVEKACADYRVEHGCYPSAHVKERIKFEVAEASLRAQRGINGDVLADADIRKWIADQYAATRASVAGYDLVFTPAKSVSVLWGLGDDHLRRAVQQAHDQAVTETLAWIEAEVAYTRRGAGGKEVIKADGLLIARFDHWDNRAGDPNLHTHAAVANRVHADGRWTTIDGRVFYRAAVAASERYNSRITDILGRQLGVSFSPGPTAASRKQPVYEVDGVPRPLLEEFSRRGDIEERMAELADEYLAQNGKNPPKKLQYAIAQQATLDTRKGKKNPQTLAGLRSEWADRAARLTGSESPLSQVDAIADVRPTYRPEQLPGLAQQVIDTLSRRQGTWTVWNVAAEVQRRLREFRFSSDHDLGAAAQQATEMVITGWSIEVFRVYRDAPDRLADRAIGGVQRLHTTDPARMIYTSQQVLNAEEYMRLRAEEPSNLTVPQRIIERAMSDIERSSGHELGTDQTALVNHFLTAGQHVAVGVGAAGTGKTTAMKVVARAWERCHGKVIALGPSARAAEVLGEEIGVEGRTIADLLTRDQHGLPTGITAGDLLLVDEAGMASARNLADLSEIAAREGAVVRLLGDPQQLPSVESSGILRDLAERTQAPMLSTVHRFTTGGEADASLRLRAGQAEALDWYAEHQRIREAMKHQLPDLVFGAYSADIAAGNLALMIAPTNDLVIELNTRAAAFYRANGTVTGPEVSLSDGLAGAAGDIVVTRRNTSKYEVRGRDGKRGGRIKNGDLWRIAETRTDGSTLVENLVSGGQADLPVDYVTSHVQLGYASTVHRAQGMTVATAHVVADAAMTRQSLYVALTRGKHANNVYVANDELPDFDAEHVSDPHPGARRLLTRIISRDGAQKTALEELAAARTQAESLPESLTLYNQAAMVLYSGLAEKIIVEAHGEAALAKLLADPVWDRIVYATGQSESFGWNTRELITAATASGGVAEASQSFAAATRDLPRRRNDLASRYQLVAISARAAAIDFIVARWASEQLAHIGGHVARYLTAAQDEEAPWLTACGTPGEDAEQRRAFDAALTEIAMSRLTASQPGDDPLDALTDKRRDVVNSRLRFATLPVKRSERTDAVLLSDQVASRERWAQAGVSLWQAREALSQAQARHRAAIEYLQQSGNAGIRDDGTFAARMRLTIDAADSEIARLNAHVARCEHDYRELEQQTNEVDADVVRRSPSADQSRHRTKQSETGRSQPLTPDRHRESPGYGLGN